MPIQLKSPNLGFPPGGWLFDDPHTAAHFAGEDLDLETLCKQVADHRRANPHIYKPDQPLYFDLAAIRQEVIVQTCSRLPDLCEDSALSVQPQPSLPVAPPPQPTVQASPRPNGKPCARCGSGNFSPVICHSCGGGRVTGWRCVACGFED